MKNVTEHIESAIISKPQSLSYGPMYSMHKYWSKKPADVVSHYIERYTEKGDVVLDPFCGSGVTAAEALRLGRKSATIDLNPMSTFMTKCMLTPVNLSLLKWSFRDVERTCREFASQMFVTRCDICGGKGTIEFVAREDEAPKRIAYLCACTPGRLFKTPDHNDAVLDSAASTAEIPLWYPRDVRLPVIQKERYEYVHELFTKRNLVLLSTILDAISRVENETAQEVLKLAFTACLDKCSRLKPWSNRGNEERCSLSQGWVAVRFYAPRKWQEVNPWLAFARSFQRVYSGKVKSNAVLSDVALGSNYDDLDSGRANVVILQGPAARVLADEVPDRVIDYVLTDPPYGSAIQYLSLSTFWGAWLGFDFDYDNEIVVAPKRNKTDTDYSEQMASVLRELGRVTKAAGFVHMFYNDLQGPYLHNALGLLREAGVSVERILHQPPPGSFGTAVRNGTGRYGSYIIRGRIADGIIKDTTPSVQDSLRDKLRNCAIQCLTIRNGETSLATVLHAVYQQLNEDELREFARHDAKRCLLEAIDDFTQYRLDRVSFRNGYPQECSARDLQSELKTALMDAESLFVDSEDRENRILQRVLGRFQPDGITYDDARDLRESRPRSPRKEQQLRDRQLKEHRQERFAKLLSLFGSELDFRCSTVGDCTQVYWSKPDVLQVCFDLTGQQIQVFAQSSVDGEQCKSRWGTMTYVDFEQMLWNWCDSHPDKGGVIKPNLNPPEPERSSACSANEVTGQERETQLMRLRVVQNDEVCPDHYLIRLKLPPSSRIHPRPGQFFHLICDAKAGQDRDYPLTLRRPFSIHGARYPDFDRRLLARSGDFPAEIRNILTNRPEEIVFLYKVVGEGTRDLRNIKPGSSIDAMGPCGNGFEKGSERVAVIVAGGIGIAPLVALAERLRFHDREVHMYLGALKKELLAPAVCKPDLFGRPDRVVEQCFGNGSREFRDLIREEFAEIGTKAVDICTDDGSEGKRGLVTDILRDDFQSGKLSATDTRIYACGPSRMLHAIAEIASENSVECMVLMEERMACGIGACMSCTCNVKDPNGTAWKKRVCRDGPVFRASEVVWRE